MFSKELRLLGMVPSSSAIFFGGGEYSIAAGRLLPSAWICLRAGALEMERVPFVPFPWKHSSERAFALTAVGVCFEAWGL